MNVEICPFGKLFGGNPVNLYTLYDNDGAYVELLDYGVTVRSTYVPDKFGKLKDVVLGYDTLEEYEADTEYLAAQAGKYGMIAAYDGMSITF